MSEPEYQDVTESFDLSLLVLPPGYRVRTERCLAWECEVGYPAMRLVVEREKA